MPNLLRYSLIALLTLLAVPSARADVVSLESNYVAGQTDIVTKLNNDRLALTNGVNNIRGVYTGSVQTSGQIKADTIGEENMADDSNPRVRTNEAAFCPDVVVSGLLPSTTSGTLVGSVTAGTAYPDGYRVAKTDSTAKNFTASMWTYGYLLTSGSLSYQEQTIGGSEPSQPANSAKLFRVSTDATSITHVLDLRKTNCASGPFEAIADTTGEATLDDMLSKGVPVRRFTPAGRTPVGFVQGLFVSYDTVSTFTVTAGAAYVGGRFRRLSNDTVVTKAEDAPLTGGHGIDAGAAVADTRYYVYAVADQPNSPDLSISYSTSSSAPSGTTYSRKLGAIRTSKDTLFVSDDLVTVHGIGEYEVAGGWLRMEGNTGQPRMNKSYNVSALAENAEAGNWTITWDADFASADYVVVGSCGSGASGYGNYLFTTGAIAAGTAQVFCINTGANKVEAPQVNVMAIGDTRR